MAKKFEKLKIKLTENNEKMFREIYQFVETTYSFEEFINNWIKHKLSKDGLE